MSDKLLVVEDSNAIARVIQQIGQALDYEVLVAGSLAEVKNLLAQDHQFFAATIDYGLPDAANGEAIEVVLNHGIPGIVMTGRMDEATRQKILSRPVIDYIPKENSQAFMYLKRILFWQKANAGMEILVVDDSITARSHVVELLQRRNFVVYQAESGVAALAVIAEHPNIKLVITDAEMPEMGGIELTNEIRKQYSRDQMAIIGISGAANGIHSARFIKNGADDFLRKPFCPEEFYCRMTQNIENLYNIEQIQKAANTDYLTELPNRRSFFSEGQQTITQWQHQQACYALAMLDIDHFKRINDTYGHDAGDHVLKVLALYLRKYFAKGLIARLGGEEFAVLYAADDQDEIWQVFEDFRQAVADMSVSFERLEIRFTVSLGIEFNSKQSLACQLADADKALYQAKESGRNKICVS